MAIPDVGLSHKSHLSLAKEAVPGTAATVADAKYEVISAKPQAGLSQIRSRSMNPTGGSPSFIGQGPSQPRITATLQVNYQGFEYLWRAVLATYTNAVVSGTTRDHTFKEAADPNTYTLDLSTGDLPASKVWQLVGARLLSLDLKGEVGGFLEVDTEWAGISLTENVTPMTAATINQFDGILWSEAVAANILDGSGVAGANIAAQSFGLSLKIPHKTDRGYLGSVNPARPVRTSNFEFNWTFKLEYADTTLANKARTNAAAAGGLELLFRGAAITGGFYELALKASAPKAPTFDVEVPNFDIITQEVNWGLQRNTTDAGALVIRTRSVQGVLA